MNNTCGYKGMLRNRCPATTNYALKWQKAKERWINHTYKSFVKIFIDKQERLRVTHLIIKNLDNFEQSIDWDNLTPEEEEYWKRIASWIHWFKNNYSEIKTEYVDSLNNGEDIFTIKVNIIKSHLSDLLPNKTANREEKQAKFKYVDKLVDYLIDCFEGRILIQRTMLNVFSDNTLKMSKQIKALRKCAGSNYERLLFAGPKDEPLYMLKPNIINILEWVNKKILFELPRVKNSSEVQWIGVRLRIATNMLNKQVTKGILTKEIAIEYHQRMTSRTREILGKIYTEDLPFLP